MKSRSDWGLTLSTWDQAEAVHQLRAETVRAQVCCGVTHLIRLDARVLGDDTRSAARGIEQDPVESPDDFRELAAVVGAHDDVFAA